MIGGVVLAGGASSRMGRPKALLPLGVCSLAERVVNLFAPHCYETIIVTGAHDLEIRQGLPHLAATMVYNSNHALGMFSSLRVGLAHFPEATAILFSPVDFAAVRPSSVAALFSAPPSPLVKLRFQGCSGHPVLLRSQALAALRAAPLSANAKDLLSLVPALYVDVEDSAVAEDCDTPEDYRCLLDRWRSA